MQCVPPSKQASSRPQSQGNLAFRNPMLGRHWRRDPAEEGQWSDWVLVGNALLEGRGTQRPRPSIGDQWTYGRIPQLAIENGFNLPASAHTNLIAVMSALPSIEEWRSTLTETQRLRLSHPSAVLKCDQACTGECISPKAPPPPTP